jgi:23S rRNA pseudouridine2605 synthase
MFEVVGHHVEKIKRVRYGPLTLDVPPGKFRSLTLKEVERLKAVSTAKAGSAKAGGAKRTPQNART